jgi:hypothetical protein
LSLSRFVVHEDKIRYRNRTLSCRFGGSPAQERYSIRNLLLGMTIYFSDWNKSSEWCVPQSNPRILFVFDEVIAPGSHEMSAGPYQINSTNIWPFRYVHCAFMASCMRWHSSFGDVQSCDIYCLFELTHVPLFVCPFSWNSESDLDSVLFSRRIPIRPGHIPCDVQNKAYICILVCCVLFSSIRWRKVRVTSVSYRQTRSW